MLDTNGYYITKLNKRGLDNFIKIHKTIERFEKIIGCKAKNLRFKGLNPNECLWFNTENDSFIIDMHEPYYNRIQTTDYNVDILKNILKNIN